MSDTGIGLPPDFAERSKTSLGLQLVGELSKQLGGSFKVESTPNEGATFTAIFTVQDSEVSPVPVSQIAS